MKHLLWSFSLVVIGLTLCTTSRAQDASDSTESAESQEDPAHDESAESQEDPAHDELRALREELLTAIGKSDLDTILGLCDEEVVLTAQHAEVARGHDGLKSYLEKMMKGPDAIVKRYTVEPTIDTLSILHNGDTAIAYGSSKDQFDLTDGSSFTLNSRWTTTLVKKDGKWLIAALHSSANVLDNTILDVAKGWIVKGSVIAGVVGLIVGMILVSILKRKKTETPAESST